MKEGAAIGSDARDSAAGHTQEDNLWILNQTIDLIVVTEVLCESHGNEIRSTHRDRGNFIL
jgi:hypothetical protein